MGFPVFLCQNTENFRACGAQKFQLFRGIQRQFQSKSDAEGAENFGFSGGVQRGDEVEDSAPQAREKNEFFGTVQRRNAPQAAQNRPNLLKILQI